MRGRVPRTRALDAHVRHAMAVRLLPALLAGAMVIAPFFIPPRARVRRLHSCRILSNARPARDWMKASKACAHSTVSFAAVTRLDVKDRQFRANAVHADPLARVKQVSAE
jgi:hypothetical protein